MTPKYEAGVIIVQFESGTPLATIDRVLNARSRIATLSSMKLQYTVSVPKGTEQEHISELLKLPEVKHAHLNRIHRISFRGSLSDVIRKK